MAELFRLKVSDKQTIDLPARLSSRLGLKSGDELELLIGDDDRLTVTTIKGFGAGSEPTAEAIQELERRANRESAQKAEPELLMLTQNDQNQLLEALANPNVAASKLRRAFAEEDVKEEAPFSELFEIPIVAEVGARVMVSGQHVMSTHKPAASLFKAIGSMGETIELLKAVAAGFPRR